MTDFLGRKYKSKSLHLFDEYMKALGVNLMLRKIGTTISSEFLLTEKEPGLYQMAITSTFRSQYLDFRPGEEIDETTLDYRKVKSTFTLEPNRLVQIQRGHKDSTIVRTFTDDELRITLSVDDIVATMVLEYCGTV